MEMKVGLAIAPIGCENCIHRSVCRHMETGGVLYQQLSEQLKIPTEVTPFKIKLECAQKSVASFCGTNGTNGTIR